MIFFKKNKGFTLVETIVAIAILLLGIFSALTLMASSLSFSQSSEQMIVVVNLAREGVEMVRVVRDMEGFDSAKLDEGDKIITIDTNDGDLEVNSAGTSQIEDCVVCDLYFKNDRYVHDVSGALTIFKRLIIIENMDNSPVTEKKIVSTIYWTERGRSHTFKLETYIKDW